MLSRCVVYSGGMKLPMDILVTPQRNLCVISQCKAEHEAEGTLLILFLSFTIGTVRPVNSATLLTILEGIIDNV